MATFYRIVQTNPPTEADFLSYQARGIPLRRDTPYHRRLWEGVSVSATEAAARSLARRLPAMGRFIATLEVPEYGTITYEQTTDVPTHYTLWGEPHAMLESVTSVMPV